jgi:hypothetical protein
VYPSLAGSPPTDPTTDRRLSDTECRSLLGEGSQGRLGHQTGRGPRAAVVRYAVTDDQVVFRLPEYNEICQYAPGRQITLNVSRVCANTRTEVIVTGVGFVPENSADLLASVDLAETWPPGISTYIICLDLAVVEGSTACSRGADSRPHGTSAGISSTPAVCRPS